VPHLIEEVATHSDIGEPNPSRPAKQPGGAIGWISRIAAIVWVLGCAVCAAALLGVDGVMSLPPLQMGALVAAALLPALMAWYSGAAASEAVRARAEARRLADAADRLLNPEQSSELAAKRLAVTIRSEIGALDRALEQTLGRLNEVETAITRQSKVVDDMSNQAKVGAGHMISGMERERAELKQISEDLTRQAQLIGDSISRHSKSVADAARAAEGEIRAADQALDHRITSFGAAAALISDRTNALSTAAQTSADSAMHLENALSGALEALSKATSLTDAARQSAQDATIAANATAGAVRDATHRAIEDAKRAADLVRGEAAQVEEDATAALMRLREAAEAARQAAMEARVAAEANAAYGSAYAPAHLRRPPQAEPPQHAYQPQRPAPPMPRDIGHDVDDDPFNLESAPPPSSQRRRAPEQRHDPRNEPRREPAADFGEPPHAGDPEPHNEPPSGNWTWKELLSGIDESGAPRAARAQRAPEAPAPSHAAPARHTREPHAGESLAIAAVIEQSGLRINEVFSASGLERIAQRARNGSNARRRAVKDAAPDAVDRLAEYLRQNSSDNQEAMKFLRVEGGRIAELLGRGRAAMGAEATRAFLLIDAAAA
jgi:hypothetical protein